MPSSSFRAVVFDFDGTLSVPTLDFSVMRQRVHEALSLYSSAPFNTQKPSLEHIRDVCALLSPQQAQQAEQAALQAIVDVEVEAARRSSLFPFVRPALAALQQNKIAIGIITRNCPQAVFTVFPDLDEHIPCLLTRDDVDNVKPHPEHLEKALEQLKCPAEQTLMVGDHPMDIIVGQRVGTMTGAVLTGDSNRERLEEANPTFIAPDIAELLHMAGITTR